MAATEAATMLALYALLDPDALLLRRRGLQFRFRSSLEDVVAFSLLRAAAVLLAYGFGAGRRYQRRAPPSRAACRRRAARAGRCAAVLACLMLVAAKQGLLPRGPCQPGQLRRQFWEAMHRDGALPGGAAGRGARAARGRRPTRGALRPRNRPYLYTAVAFAAVGLPFVAVKLALLERRRVWPPEAALLLAASAGFSVVHVVTARGMVLWARRRYESGLLGFGRAPPRSALTASVPCASDLQQWAAARAGGAGRASPRRSHCMRGGAPCLPLRPAGAPTGYHAASPSLACGEHAARSSGRWSNRRPAVPPAGWLLAG